MLNMHQQGKYCLKKKFYRCLSVASLSMASTMSFSHIVLAADETVQEAPRKNYSIPAGPLSKAISEYAAETGVRLTFDPSIAKDKQTKGLDGEYSVDEGFNRLLKDSGLEAIDDQAGGYFLVPALPALGEESTLTLEKVNVRAQRFYELGPLPGLGLTKEEIPGNVQSLSAKDIKDSQSLSMTDLFNTKLQGVTVNDYQGNPFQMDVQYRGFSAGPQIGTPQGLSVFFDGIRVNEPFGDVVNWDMIPMNAIANVDVFPGSNPIFGLNTLGGAFTMKTKDGFNNTDTDIQVLKGSFGREQLQAESGWNNGTIAFFGAGSFFMEDGWRENSPSEVNQAFGKASYRGERLDINLSTLLVETDLVGNGLIPSEEYDRDRDSVFTSPDTTENKLQQFQLASAFQVNDTFSITGQVYRRNSDRHQQGADVMTDYSDELIAKRLPADGEEYTCLFNSTNDYGYEVPDYFVLPFENYDPFITDIYTSDFLTDVFSLSPEDLQSKYASNINTELPDEFIKAFQYQFDYNRNFREQVAYDRNVTPINPNGPTNPDFPLENEYSANFGYSLIGVGTSSGFGAVFEDTNYFFTRTTDAGGNEVITKNYVILLPAVNEDTCQGTRSTVNNYEITDPDTGNPVLVDGAGLGQPGYIEGTPTAVITDNRINQTTDGASIQFNWNLEKHKFMVGLSIDDASAEYNNSQQLGFFDANRNGYLDPDQAHPQFAAAFTPINNNDFSGTNTTKSMYFSETWNPVENWHFNFSGRYNDTKTKNKVATRSGNFAYSIGDVIAEPDQYNICPDGDCSGIPTNFRLLRLDDTVDEAETETFSFYSFNPSLGATWQASNNVNVYANWSQGTRVPSVIELGCAADKTPSGITYTDGEGGFYEIPKSVQENRQCYLPTTLSGDPYLPQIKATSHDIGIRGSIGENLQWNIGAYQTDLKDDIYFVALNNGLGFFDTIGDTRRRGIEAGLSGQKGKWGFSVNYALTDATFENDFYMFSDANSSAEQIPGIGLSVIKVEKGSTMPGVPLHNLNATINYQVTTKWQVGFTAVAHSDSYVRGNENNEHKVGETQYRQVVLPDGSTGLAPRQTAYNPGKVPGFVTFNFQTNYRFTPNLNVSFLVNNIFDKEYFSAGRLGRNPFSPSIDGAIGPSGYNHNSSDWLSTNFVAPGAPRGAWLSLNWLF